MAAFTTGYNSQGAGANYAFMTMGIEDDLFHEEANETFWKQSWSKYTPFQQAVLQQSFQNAGLGKNNISNLNKTPDFLSRSHILQHYPAIRSNVESGVEESSWVNAAALYVIRSLSIKIGTQNVFSIDGHVMLNLLDLHGQTEHYKDLIGFAYTKNQLISDSKRDRNLYAPMIGFPFQESPQTAFVIGPIAFHNVTCELLTRPLSDMTVNYGALSANNALYALPKEIKTNAVVTSNSVEFGLATNCVWVSGEERLSLINHYNEIIFKEYIKAAEQSIPASATEARQDIDVNIKGPCAHIIVTIQSQADLDTKNHTKLCQDSGEDWIKEMMLITGTLAREDGLPAEAYRTLKVIECFKRSTNRHQYVLGFEHDATSDQMTGHQNMTNIDRLKFSALYNPHATALNVRIDAAVYQGVYVERGTGGRVWG